MKKNKLFTVPLFLLVSLLFACGSKVIITRGHIYNTAWAKGEYQGFTIAKIKLLDSAISIYNKEFYVSDLNKHVIDSSFCYGAGRNRNMQNKMPKIYFDRESDLLVWYNWENILEHRKIIGLLELNSWYVINGMGRTGVYYVYIDTVGKSHGCSFGPTNL